MQAANIKLDEPSDVSNNWRNSFRHEGLILQVLIHYHKPLDSQNMKYTISVYHTEFADFRHQALAFLLLLNCFKRSNLEEYVQIWSYLGNLVRSHLLPLALHWRNILL
eukprot:UN02442